MELSMRMTTGKEDISLDLYQTEFPRLTIKKLPKAEEEHGGRTEGGEDGRMFLFRGEKEVIRRSAERRQISGSTTSADAVTMRNGKSAHSHTLKSCSN